MEALDQARKDACKAFNVAKQNLDDSIKVAAESLVFGVSIASSAIADATRASSDLLDKGKVIANCKISRHQHRSNDSRLPLQTYLDTGIKQYKEYEDLAFATATGGIMTRPCCHACRGLRTDQYEA